ncbi:hypothetical protein BKA70DRAFT_1382097 [Coprinopsis sp. MPI-PUGE-AT-0042]|nr:hypothetical protein BKA70DRAFT_1382097 [Coprinopsis sp. MPI-PUGE-AT-0042]
MDSDPTELYLPRELSYPLKVVSLDAAAGSEVTRGTRLLSYSFIYVSKDSDSKPETRFGTWDASIEGTLDRWNIEVGAVLSQKAAAEKPALVIIEPCKHGMQLGGMCVVCGKDMTEIDYTGYSDASRASIQMTHSAFGPTVSFEEAQRIERETANHLLKSRRLSLIVDLDQTIVHATVDPTVGEWITEGEAWEARQASKVNRSTTPKDDADSDASSDEEDSDEEECNPNWEALKDVKKFTLGPESFGTAATRKAPGKQRVVEHDGCMYYIKPRPGWEQFLLDASKKYELHVYTMGTRAYAEQVCKAIDPAGRIFGNRILSRDESGSLTQKSLQRLFPCDTSMVVIIDDRADVWDWSPNLVKVIPYDFFVGIGDINSTFLPKLDASSLTPPPPQVSTDKESKTTNGALPNPLAKDGTTADGNETVIAQDKTILVNENNAALDAQLEERPLAKKEKELQEHEEAAELEQTESPTPSASESPDPTPQSHHHHRKALLKNDDIELQRVGKILNEVHERFFSSYESDKQKHLSGSKLYDVTRIIPRIRTEALEGCHILFSGLIPLDTRPDTTDIWRSATMFGARCYTELSKEVTHVVAAKLGTVKVDMARKRGGIAIVSQAWLSESIAQWRRMDETPYLFEDATPSVAPVEGTKSHHHPGMLDNGDTNGEHHSKDGGIDDDEAGDDEIAEDAPVNIESLSWFDINDEIDGAMLEDWGEDDDDDGASVQSDSSEAFSGTKRKRLRSTTPSEAMDEIDLLRSPLAKRKKVVAERAGTSRLKEGVTADDYGNESEGVGEAQAQAEEESEEEEPFDPDDDFLAGELEEEWS